MCTATWLIRDESYELYFNRDELRTRKEALPPEIRRHGDVRFISPIDRDAGGTWIGVNDRAVCIFLLNLYDGGYSGLREDSHVSRGRLVLDLMDAADAVEVGERLNTFDMERYRPFTLGVIGRRCSPRAFIWNGTRLSTRRDAVPPLSSSSYETKDVIASRRKVFRELGTADSPHLAGYHREHHPVKGPYSVCMHRGDAKTVSLSEIKVSKNEIRFDYTTGSPCEGAAVQQKRIDPRI